MQTKLSIIFRVSPRYLTGMHAPNCFSIKVRQSVHFLFFVKWVWITCHEHFECSFDIVDDHYFSKYTIYHEYDNSIINAYFAKYI